MEAGATKLQNALVKMHRTWVCIWINNDIYLQKRCLAAECMHSYIATYMYLHVHMHECHSHSHWSYPSTNVISWNTWIMSTLILHLLKCLKILELLARTILCICTCCCLLIWNRVVHALLVLRTCIPLGLQGFVSFRTATLHGHLCPYSKTYYLLLCR